MTFQGAIFDVDGVLVDSPHEPAWRDSLRELMEGDWADIAGQTTWTADGFTSQVYQKVLSIYGVIADPATQPLEGNLTVSRLDDGFPPTYWPVSESHFKALIYLMPGPNKLRLNSGSAARPSALSSSMPMESARVWSKSKRSKNLSPNGRKCSPPSSSM